MFSVCIPRMFTNISEQRIRNTFSDLEIGNISHVDFVLKRNKDGKEYNMVFVHFSELFDCEAANHFKEDVENPEKQAKIVYEDPWYWIVLPNTGKQNDQQQNMIYMSEQQQQYQMSQMQFNPYHMPVVYMAPPSNHFGQYYYSYFTPQDYQPNYHGYEPSIHYQKKMRKQLSKPKQKINIDYGKELEEGEIEQ